MTRRLGWKSLLAVPLMALAALFSAVLPANAATGPYGFPILYAASGNVAHHCEILGVNSQGYEAIVCVDIDTYGDGSEYYATGAVEAYCQNATTSATVACYGIDIHSVFANAATGASTASYSCWGNCPGGRKILYTTTYDFTAQNCTSLSSHNVWSEAAGTTDITGPNRIGGFGVASNGANDGSSYSSGHYWVCP